MTDRDELARRVARIHGVPTRMLSSQVEVFRRVGASFGQIHAGSAAFGRSVAQAVAQLEQIRLGIVDTEPPIDPDKPCMVCGEQPRLVPIYGGGQVCEECARDIPTDMLPAGWRY